MPCSCPAPTSMRVFPCQDPYRVVSVSICQSLPIVEEPSRTPTETYSKKRRKGLTDKSNLRHKYHK